MKFIAELQILSEFCEFSDMLDGMIRDRLVCRINDENIQQILLSESVLTLTKVTWLAQAAESAKQDAPEISKGTHKSPHA